MAPGGVETSVFHNTIVPESAQVDFSFDTPGMRNFRLAVCDRIRDVYREVFTFGRVGD